MEGLGPPPGLEFRTHPLEGLGPPPGLEFRTHPPSFGHPEMCRRPCVHMFQRGQCHQGHLCSFCHGPHDAPPYKMRARLRRLFSSLPREDQMFIILAHLSQRFAQPGFPAEAAVLLQCLHSEWGDSQSDQQSGPLRLHLTSGDLRSMQHAFWRMPLFAVFTHFPHSSPELVHYLIEQVRRNMASGESNSQSSSATVVSCYRLSL